MTYRERREAKADRLRGWADKRETKATAGLEQARSMASVIPFGQPILVGHHSERRDRNYRGRIDRTFERAFTDANKAENMNSRANGIERQLSESIYDDDPDAIEALTARIAALEAERATVKAENAAYRKAHKVELAAMTAYERNQAVPHPAYVGQNLSGNIKRNRDRLALLTARAERQEAAEWAGGTLVEPLPHDYVRVTFSEKPARDVLDALKAAGFRWGQGAWTGKADQLPEGL